MSLAPGSTAWLLGHEIRLAFRGARARAGRRRVGLVVWLPMLVLLAMMLLLGAILGVWLIDYQVPVNTQTMVIATADRKSTRLNSSHPSKSRMPSSA